MYSTLILWNTELLQNLNNIAGFSPLTDHLISYLADWPILTIPLFLIGIWLYDVYQHKTAYKKIALFTFCASILALLINLLIQHIWLMPRPESALTASAKLLLNHLPDASFPSDHASIGFAFAFSLYWQRMRKIGISYLILMIIMAIARVVAGVHWPLDILVGAMIGTMSALIVNHYFNHFINLKIIPRILTLMALLKL